MPIMDSKEPSKSGTRGRGRPPGRTPSYTVFARISPEVGKAFEEHLKTIKPKTTMGALVELAMEEYLSRHGVSIPAPGD